MTYGNKILEFANYLKPTKNMRYHLSDFSKTPPILTISPVAAIKPNLSTLRTLFYTITLLCSLFLLSTQSVLLLTTCFLSSISSFILILSTYNPLVSTSFILASFIPNPAVSSLLILSPFIVTPRPAYRLLY